MIEGSSDKKIKDEEEQGDDHAQANAWHASFVYTLYRDIRSIFILSDHFLAFL